MSMNVVHLNALKALDAAIRTGSFKAAADELSVSPAAVGQQIRLLEEYLNCKLFERTKFGAKPTARTHAVAEQLTNGFLMLDGVVSQLRSHRPKNRVAITLPSSFTENWFSHRLSDLYRWESELDLRLDASNRMVDLAREDLDFALRYSSPPDEDFEQDVLFGDYVLPVCSPLFAEEYGLSIDQPSLTDVPLVHLVSRTPDPHWPDWPMWASTMAIDFSRENSGVHVSQMSSGLQPAISGQGLVLCGIVEAFHSIQLGHLVVPFGVRRNHPTGYRYRLVHLRSRKLSSLQQRFREWIVEMSEDFAGEMTEFLGVRRERR